MEQQERQQIQAVVHKMLGAMVDVAQRSLAAGKRNVIELAYLSGFEDSNSFYRSLRRWTGRRRSLIAGRSTSEAFAAPPLAAEPEVNSHPIPEFPQLVLRQVMQQHARSFGLI